MSRPSDRAVNVEAVKVALRQDKNGFILTLAIHPNDIPEQLIRDWVGTRYMVALVALNDQDEPKETYPVRSNGEDPVALAGALCREQRFQFWIMDYARAHGVAVIGPDTPVTEDGARQAIHKLLGISSRVELRDSPEARERFNEVVREYRESWEI